MEPDSPPGADETVGERLKRLRRERGLSQRELAAPGVSYAYISRIEAGTRQPSVKALRRLASRLDVTADYLETGSELDAEAERELRLGELELAVRLGEHERAAEALVAVLEEAAAAGDRPAALRARVALAQLALEAGDDAQAVPLLEDALDGEPFLPVEQFDLYSELGRAYAGAGQPERAAALFERCLAAATQQGTDAAIEARYAMLLGYALADIGELERADEVVRAAFDRIGDTRDPYMHVRLSWSAGRLAHLRGDDSSALASMRKAIALLQATDDTLYLARAHVLAAGISLGRGDAAEAAVHVESAERLLGVDPLPADAFELARHRARIALLQGRLEEAAAYARAALVRATTPGDEAEATVAVADTLAALGDPSAAGSYARAVELLAQSGRWRSAAEACRGWSSLLEAAGDERAAREVLRRGDAFARRATAARAPA